MVSSRVARRTRLFATPILEASFLTSTFVSPLVTTTTNAPSTANTKLLTIDSTSTPSASALDATSGVSAPSHRTSVAAPSRAASQEARSFDVRIAGPTGPDAPVDSTSVAETRSSRATDAVATRPFASRRVRFSVDARPRLKTAPIASTRVFERVPSGARPEPDERPAAALAHVARASMRARLLADAQPQSERSG